MATEKITNNAVTTLNGSINGAVTSLVVTSATAFPTAGDFRIVVDSEIMLVTAVSSNTFTVTRAHEGSTAASHASGAEVALVVTAGSLTKLFSDLGGTGTLGDRKPSTPGSFDEEFDGTADTLPANWSWSAAPSGSDGWTVNSRWPSLLTVEGTGNTNYNLIRSSFTPGAIDFGIWVKGWVAPLVQLERDFRFYLFNSGLTEGKGMEFYAPDANSHAVRALQTKSSVESVALGFDGDGTVSDQIRTQFYLGLTRTSANVWRGWYSDNGIAWKATPSSDSHSFTVDRIHVRLPTDSVLSFSGLDWVRYRTDLLFPRP